MEFNFIIFSAPKPSYHHQTFDNLIYIPRPSLLENERQHVPCLYIPSPEVSNKLIIFFHGNSSDIGKSHKFVTPISAAFNVNTVCVEYPSYGLYRGKPNSERMKEDAEIVFDYFRNLGYLAENIIVLGRSIGTGPATHLASVRKPRMLILISPYTCLQDIAEFKVGAWAKGLLAERFRNIDSIQNVECPTLFIHGKADSLIPYQHSEELCKRVKGVGILSLLENQGHQHFTIMGQIVPAIKDFMDSIGFEKEKKSENLEEMEYVGIPLRIFQYPGKQKKGR